MKHRNSFRYQLRFPVIFRWQDTQKSSHHAGGFTRDISTGGLFISSSATPPAGTEVAFEVLMPPLKEESKSVRLQGEGRVAHVAGKGFGVTIVACTTQPE